MNDITFVNLTDYDIVLETVSGDYIRIPALDKRIKPPKVPNKLIKTGMVGGIPFEVRLKKSPERLPPPKEGIIYLVTGMISEMAERDDVLTVSELNSTQDKAGFIKVYRRAVRYTRKEI